MPDDMADKQIVSPKREAILAAATKLFLERGYGDVSMDKIAAEADVSKRTVYSHFENKEQLFEGIMNEMCACRTSHEELFTETQYTELPVTEFLYKLGIEFIDSMIEPDSVSLYRAIVCQSERFPEAGLKYFEFGPASCIRHFAEYLSAKSEAGELSVDDPVKAATQYFSMLSMMMIMELSTNVRKSYSDDEIETQVTGTIDTFLKAFGA